MLLKIVGVLKFQSFIPLLSHLLNKEDKVRIISEILNSVTNIISIESYKLLVTFFSNPKNKNYLPKFNGYLKMFYAKSPLIYHFDLFYRDRGDVKNIELSTNYLINNLDETYVKDLLPAIYSKYKTISFEALRLFEKKPGSLFYNSINDLFLTKYEEDNLYYKQLVKTLFNNVLVSPHKKKISVKLKDQLKILSHKRKNYFIVFLLKLDTETIINKALTIYKELEIDEKILFFNNLDANKYMFYTEFIKNKFIEEVNDKILLRIIFIFMINNEYEFVFHTTMKQKGARREKLLNLIIETGKKNLSDYFSKFLTLKEDNNILQNVIAYIMNDKPDVYYKDIISILFSGIDLKIKQKIIRSIKFFNTSNVKKVIKNILDQPNVLSFIEKDFLLMLISLQEKNTFDGLLLEQLLNYILKMMEEARQEDIINFIFFFDSFEFTKQEHKTLIIDEFKMIQKTLLRSPENDNLVSMIYKLIPKLDA